MLCGLSHPFLEVVSHVGFASQAFAHAVGAGVELPVEHSLPCHLMLHTICLTAQQRRPRAQQVKVFVQADLLAAGAHRLRWGQLRLPLSKLLLLRGDRTRSYSPQWKVLCAGQAASSVQASPIASGSVASALLCRRRARAAGAQARLS